MRGGTFRFWCGPSLSSLPGKAADLESPTSRGPLSRGVPDSLGTWGLGQGLPPRIFPASNGLLGGGGPWWLRLADRSPIPPLVTPSTVPSRSQPPSCLCWMTRAAPAGLSVFLRSFHLLSASPLSRDVTLLLSTLPSSPFLPGKSLSPYSDLPGP